MSRRNSTADSARPADDRVPLSVTTPAVLRLQSAAASAGPRSRSSSISNPSAPSQDLSASISSLPDGVFSTARPTNLSSSFSSISNDLHPSHKQNSSIDSTTQNKPNGASRFSYHLPNANGTNGAPAPNRQQRSDPLTPSTTSVPPSANASPRSHHSDSAPSVRPPLARPPSGAPRSQPSPSGSVGTARRPSAAGFAVPQGRPAPAPSGARPPQNRSRRRSSSDSENDSDSGSDGSDGDSSPERGRRRRHSSSDHSSDEGSGSGTGSDDHTSSEEEDEDGSDSGSGSGETGTDATDSESDSSPQRQKLIVGRRPAQSAFQQQPRPPLGRAGTSAFTPTQPPALSRISTAFSTPSQGMRTGSAGPSPVNSSPFLSRSVTSLPPPLLRAGTFSMLSANKVVPPSEVVASGGIGGLLGTGLLNFVSGTPSAHQRSISASPSLAAIPELPRSVPDMPPAYQPSDPSPSQPITVAVSAAVSTASNGSSATENKSVHTHSSSTSTGSQSKRKKKHSRRSHSSHHKSNGASQSSGAPSANPSNNTLIIPQTSSTPAPPAQPSPMAASPPPPAEVPASNKLSDEQKKEMYEIGKTIGRGRFSTVKLGRVKNTENFLAIKVISKANLKPKDQADLKKEIDALQAVSGHPHVVALKDTYEDSDKLYLVMELCEGGTLFERLLKQGKFSERTAVTVCRQIASALQHIHRCGVVHRDLKPENIMFLSKSVADEDIHIKIGDFGLSKIINADLLETMKTQCGTWAYCAPEVVESTPYTHKVDHWTLGVLMYILLGGYHPFDPWGNLEKHELMERIQAVQYSFNDPVWNDVSGKAKFLILSLLRRDPTERMALDAYLNSEWIVANQASATVRPQVLERIETFHKKSSKLRNIALAKLYGRRMIRFLERKGLRSPTTSPFASPTPSPRPFSPLDTPLSARSETVTPPRRREFTFESLADRTESKTSSRSALVFSPISPSSPSHPTSDGASDSNASKSENKQPIRPSVRASSRLNLKTATVESASKAAPAPAAVSSAAESSDSKPEVDAAESASEKSREYPYGRNSLAYYLEQQQQQSNPEEEEKTPQQFRLSDSDKAAIKAKRKQDKKTVEGLYVRLASGSVVSTEDTEEIDGAKEQNGDDDSDSLTENPEKVKEGRSKPSVDLTNNAASPTSIASALRQGEAKYSESKAPISDTGRGLPPAWYRPTAASEAPLRDNDDGAAFIPLRMKVLKDEEDEAEDAIDPRLSSEGSRGVLDVLRHAASASTPARARQSSLQTQRSPSEDKESIDIGSPLNDRSPAKESDRSAMDLGLDSSSPKKPAADQSIQRALGDIQSVHLTEEEEEESKGYDLLGISMGIVAVAAFSYGAYVWWKRKTRR